MPLLHAIGEDPSSEQEKVTLASGTTEENTKLAEVLLVGSEGLELICVSGAVVSTVHVNDAPVLVLPEESLARTENVCEPCRSVPADGEVQVA